MRTAFAASVLLGAAVLTSAQPEPVEPVPRYGVPPRVKIYPQNTAKESLKSVVAAINSGDYTYLVAHLLDPKFVDDRVADRAKLFDTTVEAELAQLREFQRANPDKVAAENRVPLDPREFRALVAVKTRGRGFKQVVKDVEQMLTDDPQSLKDIRKILREGAIADADPVASAGHPDIKGRALYLKKIDGRWFLENRQTDEKK